MVLVVEARGAVTIAAKHVDTGDVVIRTERDPVETKNEVCMDLVLFLFLKSYDTGHPHPNLTSAIADIADCLLLYASRINHASSRISLIAAAGL